MSRHRESDPAGHGWREYLTPDEQRIVDRAEQARDLWRRLKPMRSYIANEAAQRAKAAAGEKSPAPLSGMGA